MKDNQLVEIPPGDWVKLRDLYKENWPEHCLGYYTLNNFIRWKENSTIKTFKVFSLNGDWSDGTYFIVDRFHVYISNLKNDNERIHDGLNCLHLPYSVIIFDFPDRYKPVTHKFFELRGQENNCDPTIWLHISREDAIKFDIVPPPGVTLRQLKEENATTVNDAWPHHHPGSLVFVKRLIKYNESVGAFNENGELMSWVIRHSIGSLGLLQVQPKYRRHGLGSLMVKALSKQLAQNGDEVLAPVVLANIPSRNMFAKLGFRQIDELHWYLGKLNSNSIMQCDETDNE